MDNTFAISLDTTVFEKLVTVDGYEEDVATHLLSCKHDPEIGRTTMLFFIKDPSLKAKILKVVDKVLYQK